MTWSPVLPEDLWFLIVADDGASTEGSWGESSFGEQQFRFIVIMGGFEVRPFLQLPINCGEPRPNPFRFFPCGPSERNVPHRGCEAR